MSKDLDQVFNPKKYGKRMELLESSINANNKQVKYIKNYFISSFAFIVAFITFSRRKSIIPFLKEVKESFKKMKNKK